MGKQAIDNCVVKRLHQSPHIPVGVHMLCVS